MPKMEASPVLEDTSVSMDSEIRSIVSSTENLSLTLFLRSGFESVTHPLERFPFEIWNKIFSYSLKFEDLRNCYHASPLMCHAFALEHKCTVLLLPVVEILSEPKPIRRLKRIKSGKILINPVDCGYISDRDVSKLRLVSGRWNEVVHRFISHHPSQFRLEERPRPEYTLMGDTSTEFGAASLSFPHLNKLYDYCPFTCRFIYPDSPSNRSFTTRRILIRDPVLFQEHLKRRYWDSLSFILKQIGKDIWHCKFIITQSIPINQRYQRIIKLLGHMPNLKTLEIWDNAPIHEDCKSVKNRMSSSPCPTLPQLVLLKADNVSHRIFNEIIRANPHLPKLAIERHGMCCSGCRYDLTPLTRLAELSFSLYKKDDLKILEEAGFRQWPLHNLSVYFENDLLLTSQNQWLPWDRLFEVLEGFSNTVQNLKLKLPKASFYSEKKSILEVSTLRRLNMPHVKTLRLVIPNTASIDFLLPMKDSLENLKILVDYCQDSADDDYLRSMANLKNEDTIYFHGFHNRMYDSNIWDVFPKLKGSLDVGVRQTDKSLNIYFRDDFKVYSYMKKRLVTTNGYYFI